MKVLLLYDPPSPGGLGTQGDLLYRVVARRFIHIMQDKLGIA